MGLQYSTTRNMHGIIRTTTLQTAGIAVKATASVKVATHMTSVIIPMLILCEPVATILQNANPFTPTHPPKRLTTRGTKVEDMSIVIVLSPRYVLLHGTLICDKLLVGRRPSVERKQLGESCLWSLTSMVHLSIGQRESQAELLPQRKHAHDRTSRASCNTASGPTRP